MGKIFKEGKYTGLSDNRKRKNMERITFYLFQLYGIWSSISQHLNRNDRVPRVSEPGVEDFRSSGSVEELVEAVYCVMVQAGHEVLKRNVHASPGTGINMKF